MTIFTHESIIEMFLLMKNFINLKRINFVPADYPYLYTKDNTTKIF